MILNTQRNVIIAGAVLIAAVIATAAIIHKNSEPLSAAAVNTAQYPAGQYAATGQPYAAGYNAPEAATTGEGYYPITPRPAYIRQRETADVQASAPSPFAAEADADTDYRNANPGHVERAAPEHRTYYVERERHHGRSKKHSVEIVGGTAAAGAAIGAIAGGGKGAALGGLSGAGAGFVYDRLTHNR